MNWHTFWLSILIAGKLTFIGIAILLTAKFVTWKVFRDYEAGKKRKAVDHIDIYG